MSASTEQHIETLAIHAGNPAEPITGAVSVPIFQTSTYAQRAPGEHSGYEYSRTHNPTRDALQANLAALEGAKHGLCFSSGCAATDAMMHLLEPGDHVVSADDVYGGTFRIFDKVYKRLGLEFGFVPAADVAAYAQAIKPGKTKLVWLETPTNPMLSIVDIARVAELAHAAGAKVVVDNTFATPYLQRPLSLGADFVVHSVTKYLGGHGDLTAGAAVFADADSQRRGDQALAANSSVLVTATNRAIAGTYLLINDKNPALSSRDDLMINISGYAGRLPGLGSVAVDAVFG